MVKLLVATTEAQGHRTNDYAWAIDGELVFIPESCQTPGCECARGFGGLASELATTTALVVDRPDISGDDLIEALTDSLRRQGWLVGDPDTDDEILHYYLDRITVATSHFPPGTIVERDGDYIQRRTEVPPPEVRI